VNPWGILLIGVGLIMIVIGFKGSQHKVLAAIKGAKPGGASKTVAPPGSANVPAGTVLA